VADTLEHIAYDASLRALDKQEALVTDLRSRTGFLLGASSVAVSFLARNASHPSLIFSSAALLAFVAGVSASFFVLLPRPGLTFSIAGPLVYERLHDVRGDTGEVQRRLTYTAQLLWERNDTRMQPLLRAYQVATFALVVEVAAFAALVRGTIG
jgi:energy-coupling factor transporter transmembrane protein EcfT